MRPQFIPLADCLNGPILLTLEAQCRQNTGFIGTRINSDAVGPPVDVTRDGMPMNDDEAMLPIVIQEWRPDPSQVGLSLQRDVDPWANSGMNEQIVSQAQCIGEAR